jgi:hypothetical protein
MDGWLDQDKLFIGYIHFGWTNHVEHPIYIPHDDQYIQYTYHMMINIPSLETHWVMVVVLVQLCCLTTFLQSTNVKTVSVNIWEPTSPPSPHVWKQEDGYDGGGLKGTLLLLLLRCKIFADTWKHVI